MLRIFVESRQESMHTTRSAYIQAKKQYRHIKPLLESMDNGSHLPKIRLVIAFGIQLPSDQQNRSSSPDSNSLDWVYSFKSRETQ